MPKKSQLHLVKLNCFFLILFPAILLTFITLFTSIFISLYCVSLINLLVPVLSKDDLSILVILS